jgi:hypothetical protein
MWLDEVQYAFDIYILDSKNENEATFVYGV